MQSNIGNIRANHCDSSDARVDQHARCEAIRTRISIQAVIADSSKHCCIAATAVVHRPVSYADDAFEKIVAFSSSVAALLLPGRSLIHSFSCVLAVESWTTHHCTQS